jgi:hypothetical protein
MVVHSSVRFLSGTLAGAVGLALIGFGVFGWTTNGSAAHQAKRLSEAAVVAALTPICVENFMHHVDAVANLAELDKKIGLSQQGLFIEEGGWATMPGAKGPNWNVARACAELLGVRASSVRPNDKLS